MPYPPNETIASRIKRAGLPESYDVHWSKNRKEEVVKAVRDKLISFDEARWRYLLSRSEFESWQRQVARTDKKSKELELT
uniref:DUF1153 domain-containing protein n=1 Tax=Parerythrobacter lutipelagi TaxID=1964208 RepID=UPI0010F5DD31|nr:DUF1153 domain-containing protein [Parerythrobacter lutipelagi]